MKLLRLTLLFLVGTIPTMAQGIGCGGTNALPCSLGWFQIPNTQLSPVCPPIASNPNIQGIEGCNAVMADWSGGTFDSKRDRLIIWGGGHNGYLGNEVYSLNLAANPVTLTRLTNPSDPGAGYSACSDAYPDGKPASRHTYDGLSYAANVDAMISIGGSLSVCGGFSLDTWSLNMSTLGWTHKLNTAFNQFNVMSAYDPNSGNVFMNDSAQLWTYNPNSNVMTAVDTFAGGINNLGYPNLVVDPIDKFVFLIGDGNFFKWNIAGSAPYTRQDISGTVTGCSALFQGGGGHGLGADWDPVLKKIVGWSGGNSVTLFNPLTNSCSTTTFTGGPPSVTGGPCGTNSQQCNGTHGRFDYSPDAGVHVLCNDISQNCFTLRLVSYPDADFNRRATTAGVLNSQGFDTSTIFATQVDTNTPRDGFSTANPPNFTLDAANFVSGGGSAHCAIPVSSSQQPCGNYWAMFGQGANLQNFGTNSTFYVQYAFRADSNWTTTDWTAFGPGGSNTAPKLVIFDNVLSSCAFVEITTHNHNAKNLPTIYTDCGQLLATSSDGTTYDPAGLYFQQGWLAAAPFTGYQCNYNSGTFSGPNCFHFAANQWYTLYYKVSIGPSWTTPTSSIEAWIAPYGQQLKKWISLSNYNFGGQETTCNAAGTGAGSLPCNFNNLQLTQFMTAKFGGDGSPAANVWYDELLISNSPIPAPAGSVSQSGTPAVSLSVASANFFNQSLSTTSIPQIVVLTNTGTATLSITSIALTGTNPGDYAISSNSCGGSLGAGSNCVIGVTFRPTAVGSRTANLTFTTNAATSPDNVTLSGTGQAPVANFSPTSLSFGGIKVGLSSATQVITLTNTGNATMTISVISITGANPGDYSANTICGPSLAVNASCNTSITFSPLLQGLRNANFSVTSNTVTSPDLVPLSGTGFNPVSGVGTISGTGTIKVQP